MNGAARGQPWDATCCETGHSLATLYEGTTATIGYTRCRPRDASVGAERCVDATVFGFPRRGVFSIHAGGKPTTVDTSMALFHNRGDTFRTSHPGGIGDDVMWMTVSAETVCDAIREFDPGVDERGDTPFTHSYVHVGPRLFLLRGIVYDLCTRKPAPDPLLIEEAIVYLLHEAAKASVASGRRREEAPGGAAATHGRIVEHARQVLAHNYARAISLAELSDTVECSPFHLCRIFKQRAGLPIHRYLNRIRLRAIVESLPDRSRALTALAEEAGFSSHSHFTEAFGKEFGITPSAARAAFSSADIDGLRRVLDRALAS